MALSEESVSMSFGFRDGVEFEETFPEPTPAAVAPVHLEPESATPIGAAGTPPDALFAPPATPRLLVAGDAHDRGDLPEILYAEQLDRRLREAEEMVKQTVEQMRLEEEKRLAEWVRQRREEEERRVQRWVEERRTAVERTLDQRRSTEDALASRLQDMLGEWEARFEERLEQRRSDDERRRQNDEERLAAWRTELEQALSARFAEPRAARAPLPDRNGELRAALRDAVAASVSVRDIGRVLRDVLGELVQTSAFAVAVHHTVRPEVAYRYRVAADDEVGQLLRSEPLDDGPEGAAANVGAWVRGQRTLRVAGRNIRVHTAQSAVMSGDAAIGVLTLQTADHEVADAVLARVSELVALASPRLAELRETGRFRGL